MPHLAIVLNSAERHLAEVTDTPRLDAEILLAASLRVSRSKLLASLRETIDAPEFETLLNRRRSGEPIAYILGEWEFYSRRFLVAPPALVPRPETEHLVEHVVDFTAGRSSNILEVGTGTGCVAVSLAAELPTARIVATDVQRACIELARRNAQRHEVDRKIRFVRGDLFEAFTGSFDVICSNPPYIALRDRDSLPSTVRDFEDPVALFGGADGLDVIRGLVLGSRSLLKPDGLLAFEIGAGQDQAVEEMLGSAGFTDIAFLYDLAGHRRIASGIMP